MTCEQANDRLLDFIEGDTPPQQTASIREHLEHCPTCAAKYRETRQLLGDLGATRSADADWDLDARSTSGPPPIISTPPPAIGDFEIIEEIGRGGMGVVYRARQKSLNRIVALKVLSAGLPQNERSVRRFHKEAQAAARLHHTNIVPIYAQGHEAGHYYYAMELIDGKSLDCVLQDDPQRLRLTDTPTEPREAPTERLPASADREHADSRTPVEDAVGESSGSFIRSSISAILHRGVARTTRYASDCKRIARLLAEVAEALHHAHEQSVVHRDIKPQNLMLGRDDKLHITDFGLARLLDEPGLTLSTEMVGTPAYMAPEQITSGHTIDRRTDVYALGVTMYEVLTTQRPFQGDTYDQIITQVLKREPKPPRRIDPHIPADLETICVRAMEKEPRRRFPSAAELARDLRRYAEDFPIASRRVGPVGKTIRWVRRHPALTGAIAGAATIAVLVPLLLGVARGYATERTNNAWQVLMTDYREKERAESELNWLARLCGDDYRLRMVAAFAHLRTEPEVTVQLTEALAEQYPDDPDARYLLAWAYECRMLQEGDVMWAKARRQIERAGALSAEPSAAGHFFHALTVLGTNPKLAERIFDEAIRKGDDFYQAMLHQARAMNQIMYSLRDPGYYQKAVSRLDAVAASQSGKAYPRYLLSITHLLAAEIYARQAERTTEEDERRTLLRAHADSYDKSLKAARDAQEVEPESPRGYAAEAGCLESQGDFRGALQAWSRTRETGVHVSKYDRPERDAYSMRLHFWLGDHDGAETSRSDRYSPEAGYDGAEGYQADESLYQALIAASTGDRSAAEQALNSGLARTGNHAEDLLLLDAAYRLIGRPPPPTLWTGDIDFSTKLPPGWTRAWLETLVRCQRGELGWDTLGSLADPRARRTEDKTFMMAGAYFFQGLHELAAGRRAEAIDTLTKAWHTYDNENYCFRAKMIVLKLERDPAWPPWIPQDAPPP